MTLSPTPTQMNALASDLAGIWKSNYQDTMGTNWTITLGKATYYGAADLVVVGEEALSDTGGGTGASVITDQVAVCTSWIVDTTWRGGKPRNYIATPYLTSQLLNNAHITTGWAAELVTLSNDFLTAINGYTTAPFTVNELGTVRFFSKGVPLVTPVFLPYTGCKVNQRLATMRRRLGREIT